MYRLPPCTTTMYRDRLADAQRVCRRSPFPPCTKSHEKDRSTAKIKMWGYHSSPCTFCTFICTMYKSFQCTTTKKRVRAVRAARRRRATTSPAPPARRPPARRPSPARPPPPRVVDGDELYKKTWFAPVDALPARPRLLPCTATCHFLHFTCTEEEPCDARPRVQRWRYVYYVYKDHTGTRHRHVRRHAVTPRHAHVQQPHAMYRHNVRRPHATRRLPTKMQKGLPTMSQMYMFNGRYGARDDSATAKMPVRMYKKMPVQKR